MKKAKKLLALLLVCLMAVSIASCGGGGGETPPTAGDPSPTGASPGPADPSPGPADPGDPGRTLNIAAMQDSGTLYPLGVTGGFISVLYAFYEPLFETRTDGSRRWVLGTGLEMISELQYTLTIRDDVTFSNGNKLTAEDVMFSMELCRDNPQFALNVKVVDFEKTKVTGDYTIDLWYTEFNASQEPGFTQLLIMDKESYDEVALSRSPVGTGPYVVTDYVVNSHLRVTARDDYWGGDPPIKNIEFKVINEDAQIVNALATDDVDMAVIPITEADFVESLGYKVNIYNAGYTYVTLLSMLPGNPLESRDARWAVSHAIDRQAIIDVLFQGKSTITDYPCSHSAPDFEQRFLNLNETYSIGYDPDRAKDLADQSGLTGKTLRIITNGSQQHNTVAEMIQSNLLDIGIDASIVAYDQATYFPTMMDASNFEIAIFTPSSPSLLAVDILAMYLTFITLGWTGPDRDLYGEISMGAISASDEAERREKLFETVKMFVEFDPWYSLCEFVISRAQSADLRGVEYMISGSIFYQDISFN